MNKQMDMTPGSRCEVPLSRASAEMLYQGYQTLTRVQPTASDDWAALDAMRDVIRQGLIESLKKCDEMARDLVVVNGDQLLVDLRAAFDPALEMGSIQDAFSDGFFTARRRLQDCGADTSLRAKCLPSGAAVEFIDTF